MDNDKKAIIALSGGVDSAISARLLLKQGYTLKAIHIKSWDAFANNDLEGMNQDCIQGIDYKDAKKIAADLGIELILLDLTKEYWKYVFEPALQQLKRGETPNPDNFCNKFIKFGFLLDYVKKKYPGWLLATGHYANIKIIDGVNYLTTPKDKSKDQTYFLSRINKHALKDIIFPLSNYLKSEVRKMACEWNVSVMNKKDSTGLCFIGERSFEKFLTNFLDIKKGNIINYDTNKIIGEHNGYYFYTIGQNKGLNLGGQKTRLAVFKKDIKKNIIYVLPINDIRHKKNSFKLMKYNNLIGNNLFLNNQSPLMIRLRYRSNLMECTPLKDLFTYKLVNEFSVIVGGQEAVFYKNKYCLGGGTILNYE